MANLAQQALALAVKDAEDKVREIPLYSNRGPRVNQYLDTAGVPLGSPYCMSAVYTWYDEAAKTAGVKNPVIRTGYCPTGVDYFRREGLVRSNAQDAEPGDIVYYWMHVDGGYRFSHTGLVQENLGHGVLHTVEANTNNNGAREGDGVYFKTRNLTGKHIVVNMQNFSAPTPAVKPSVIVAGVDAKLYPMALELDSKLKDHFPVYEYQGSTLVGLRALTEALAGKSISGLDVGPPGSHVVKITTK